MSDLLLTVKEVTTRLKVSQRTISRLVQAGELRSIRINPRSIRFRAQEIENFLTNRESSGS